MYIVFAGAADSVFIHQFGSQGAACLQTRPVVCDQTYRLLLAVSNSQVQGCAWHRVWHRVGLLCYTVVNVALVFLKRLWRPVIGRSLLPLLPTTAVNW